MKCWGGNHWGALGNGAFGQDTVHPTPEAVSFNANVDVEDMGGGWLHHCALESGGTKVWCVGYNGYGELGDGSRTVKTVPVTVMEAAGSELTGVSSIAVGYSTNCAVMTAGGVKCWGRNDQPTGFACGDGSMNGDKLNPVWVKMIADGSDLQGAVRELYVGQFSFCALFDDDLDRMVCWGLQTMGIANPGVDPQTTTNIGYNGMAREITYFKDRGKRVKSLGLGSDHSCALLTTGTVECWGMNDRGQLGVNCGVDSFEPAPVPGLSGVASMAAGGQFTCAIISFTGEVKCWGANQLNQHGSGVAGDYYDLYTNNDQAYCGVTSVADIGVNGNPGARVLAVSGYHACATMSDFTMRCWGSSIFAQLGDHETVPCDGQSTATWVAECQNDVGREPVTVILSKEPNVNFTAFDIRGACGCCDDSMKAMGFHTDCKA